MFHRYLQRLNEDQRVAVSSPVEPGRRMIEDTAELSSASRSNAGASKSSPGLPTIGEVLPVQPTPETQAVTQVVFQQRTPITGRLIDVLA